MSSSSRRDDDDDDDAMAGYTFIWLLNSFQTDKHTSVHAVYLFVLFSAQETVYKDHENG